MISTTYLFLLIVSVAIPIVATMLYVAAVATSEWERITFNFTALNTTKDYYVNTTLRDTSNDSVAAIVERISNTSTDRWCLYNVHGGIWKTCDFLSNSTRQSSGCSSVEVIKGGHSCFHYVSDFITSKQHLSDYGKYMIKMQNNIISCAIVVLLCSVAALPIALIGFLWKVVPAIMVTAVLFLVSAIFVIFGNTIEETKLKRIRGSSTGNNCSLIFKIPDKLCTAPYMTADIGYSIIIAWLASFMYICSCTAWAYLTRLMRMEKAKNML